MKKWIFENIAIIIIIIFAAGLASAYHFKLMDAIENVWLDFVVTKSTNSDNAGKHVSLVVTADRGLIEAEHLYKMGWPWRRKTYNKVIDYLNHSGAKVITFDSVFTEKSVYSYVGENDDIDFAKKLEEAGNVALGIVFSMNEKELTEKADETVDKLIEKYETILKHVPESIRKVEYENEILKKFESPNSPQYKFIQSMYKLNNEEGLYILNEKAGSSAKKRIADYFIEINYVDKVDYSSEILRKKIVELADKYINKKKKDKIDFDSMVESDVVLALKEFVKQKFINKKKKQNNEQIQKFSIPVKKENISDKNVIPLYYSKKGMEKNIYDHVKILGNVEGTFDSDGKSRRFFMLFNFFDHYYPTLSFTSIYHFLKPETVEIRKQAIVLSNFQNKDYKDRDTITIPLTSEGHLRLKYYGSQSDAYPNKVAMVDLVKMHDYIEGLVQTYNELGFEDTIEASYLYKTKVNIKETRKKIRDKNPEALKKLDQLLLVRGESAINDLLFKVAPENFKNKVILIGDEIAAHGDIRATPFNPKEIGVLAHVTAVDNVLNNDMLIEYRHSIIQTLSIFIIAVFVYFIIQKLPILSGFSLSIFLIFASLALSYYLYVYENIVLDVVTLSVTVLLTFIIGTGVNYFKENKQKKYIQGAFGQYLSPKIIEIIMKDPSKLGLGGTEKEITAFFSDVAGFSTISEKLTASQLVHLLNVYLTDMCDVISEYDGTVDKFEGDAIIAFWGAPLDDPDHAKYACWSSIEMQEKLGELRKKWKADGEHELIYNMKMRIGLNSGQAVVGNMGSNQRMDYTMMGDTVNLAARLEGANKFYKTFTMISDSTFKLAEAHIDARELDKIRVVGKNEPVTVYHLLDKKGQTSGALADGVNIYLQALELYKQMKFAEAIPLFEKVLSLVPDDGPALTYIERCKVFIENPPPGDWDGVFTLTSKG